MAVIDFVKMIRPRDAFMVTVVAVAGIWFADTDVSWYQYLVAIIVANTYIGIAMVHNDIIDIEIDRINAPSRPLPAGKITLRQAWTYIVILFVIGTTAGLLLKLVEAIIIMLSSLVFSLLYNWKLKKLGFLGNLAVGFTATSAFLYGDAVAAGWDHFWPTSDWNASIYLFLISSLLNTSREVAKGIMDTEGDSQYGVKTIAVLYGKKNAAIVVTVLVVGAISIAILPIAIGTFGIVFILAALAFIGLLLFTVVPLLKEPNYDNAKSFKTWILPNMLLALVLVILDQIFTVTI